MSLGAGSTFIGQWGLGLLTGNTGMFIQQIAGILIVFMGFLVGGWLQIPGFMRERRLQISKSGTSYAGTFVVGIGFAAGWTPCIGPIFASILLLSAAQPAQGMVYTALYVLGFSIPFLERRICRGLPGGTQTGFVDFQCDCHPYRWPASFKVEPRTYKAYP